jgi:hypothetical protein
MSVSVRLSVCLAVCLSVYLSNCLSVYLPFCLSAYQSVCNLASRSVRLFVCMYVCLSICLSVNPPVCLCVSLPARSSFTVFQQHSDGPLKGYQLFLNLSLTVCRLFHQTINASDFNRFLTKVMIYKLF